MLKKSQNSCHHSLQLYPCTIYYETELKWGDIDLYYNVADQTMI